MESTLLVLDLMEGGWLSFIQMQAGLVIGLMISVIHRAMDVIDKAADEVPAWIGGGKQPGGEAQNVGKVQTLVAGNFSELENSMMHVRAADSKSAPLLGGDAKPH